MAISMPRDLVDLVESYNHFATADEVSEVYTYAYFSENNVSREHRPKVGPCFKKDLTYWDVKSWMLRGHAPTINQIYFYSKVDTKSTVLRINSTRIISADDATESFNTKFSQTMFVIRENGQTVVKHEGIFGYKSPSGDMRYIQGPSIERFNRYVARRSMAFLFLVSLDYRNNFLFDYDVRTPEEDGWRDVARGFSTLEAPKISINNKGSLMEQTDVIEALNTINLITKYAYKRRLAQLASFMFVFKKKPQWDYRNMMDVYNTRISIIPQKWRRKLASKLVYDEIHDAIRRYAKCDVPGEVSLANIDEIFEILGESEDIYDFRSINYSVQSAIKASEIIEPGKPRDAMLIGGRSVYRDARSLNKVFELFPHCKATPPENATRDYEIRRNYDCARDLIRMYRSLNAVEKRYVHGNTIVELHDSCSEVYHENVIPRRTASRHKEYESFEYSDEFKALENKHFRLAKPLELPVIGTKMGICVGSYIGSVVSKQIAIYVNRGKHAKVCIEVQKVFSGYEGTNSRFAALHDGEVNEYSIVQAKLSCNAPVSRDSDMIDKVLDWQKHNILLKESTCYDLSGPREPQAPVNFDPPRYAPVARPRHELNEQVRHLAQDVGPEYIPF